MFLSISYFQLPKGPRHFQVGVLGHGDQRIEISPIGNICHCQTSISPSIWGPVCKGSISGLSSLHSLGNFRFLLASFPSRMGHGGFFERNLVQLSNIASTRVTHPYQPKAKVKKTRRNRGKRPSSFWGGNMGLASNSGNLRGRCLILQKTQQLVPSKKDIRMRSGCLSSGNPPLVVVLI